MVVDTSIASINLGNIVTIISGAIIWFITIAVAWTKFGGRMDLLELRMDNVEKAMIKIADTMALLNKNETELLLLKQEVAAMQQNITTLHSTVELLRRGDGFITGPRRGNILGEYPMRENLDASR
jgi:hypothetical protein